MLYYYKIEDLLKNKKAFCEKYVLFLNNIRILFSNIPKDLLGIYIAKNEFYIILKKNSLLNYISYLFNNTLMQIKSLSDLIVVDYPGRAIRFNIIYQLMSIHYNIRFNLLVFLDELNFLNSISNNHKSATWYEREVWDMFGIFFKFNFDLRRILTDYSFDGHPLRKDFPLTGYFEVFYDDTKKRIFNMSVSLFQDFRYFFFNNPWI